MINTSIPQSLNDLLSANGWTTQTDLDKRLNIHNRQRRKQVVDKNKIEHYTLYVYRISHVDLIPAILRGQTKKGKKK